MGDLLPKQQQVLALRPATEQDAAFLSAVYRSVREPELLAVGWPSAQIEAFCEMQHRFRIAGYMQYVPLVEPHVVLWDNNPVGMLAVCRGARRWVLVNIELLASARGKGIGSELISLLQQEAKTAGVGLQLHAANTSPVVRLYERCGFTTVADDGMARQMEWPANQSVLSQRTGEQDTNGQCIAN